MVSKQLQQYKRNRVLYSPGAAQQESERREQEQRRQQSAPKRNRDKPKSTPKKPKRSPLERLSMQELETRIEESERRRDEIDQELAEPDTWSDRKRVSRLESERKQLLETLEPMEFEWSRRADEG